MIRPRRRFCWAKTCSTRTRMRPRVALPRAMCAGIGLPLGLARWNCGTRPRTTATMSPASATCAVGWASRRKPPASKSTPGFAPAEVVYDEAGQVIGVATGDMGVVSLLPEQITP